MQFTRLAIARPVAILMIIGAFIVLGLLSFTKLPKELQPEVDFPEIDVVTTYSGTSPTEMETLITKPIEDSIAGVSGVEQINSSSQQGNSLVSIQFYYGTNLDAADSQVIQKVDAIRSALPQDSDSPSVIKQDSSSEPVMYLSVQSAKRTLVDLNRLVVNTVQPQLEQATDVAGVQVYGGDTREIQVSVPESRLSAYGITIAQLAAAVKAANVNVSSGFIQQGSQYYNVRLIGEFATVDELKNLRLQLNRQSVMLGDIATVSDTYAERTSDSFLNGQRTVTLLVQKTSDGNTIDAVASVKDQMKSLAKILPSDVKFVTIKDFSKYVNDNLNDVLVSLLLGSLMAVLVVFIFLHNVRGTLIVALALPTSMIATFLPLEALGYSFNSMTGLGLSLAVGILVDDSIVVLENINRHLQLGEEPVVAAVNGRSEIGLAAIILTSVDLVVFLPIAFMGGVIGEFFRSFGITVAFATLFSLFVSFALTPMLAARWYRKGEALTSSGWFSRAFDKGFDAFERTYQKLLRACLTFHWQPRGWAAYSTESYSRGFARSVPARIRNAFFAPWRWILYGPRLTVLLGNVLLIAIFILVVPKLGFRFAPDQDQNAINIAVEGPAGGSLDYTEAICREIEQRIRANDRLNYDTQFISTTVGTSSTDGNGDTGTQYATMQLQLYNRKSVLDSLFGSREHLRPNTDISDANLIQSLIGDIPGAKIHAAAISGFNGSSAPLEVDLTGPNFPQLIDASNKVMAMIRAIPGTYNVDTSFRASQPEVQVRLDRTLAPDYSVDLQTLGSNLSDSIAGNIDTKFRDPVDGEQYNTRVQLDKPYRDTPQSVGNVIVGYSGTYNTNGSLSGTTPIYLNQVADVTLGAGPVVINRLNREREINVTSFLVPGVEVGNVSQKLTAELKKTNFPEVSWTFGGEAQDLGREGGYLATAVLLGIVLSYMLMAALFNNLLYPLSIMLSLPQAWAGAFIALLIAHQPMSLISMIGIILLNGIVNKNAILLVDYTNTLRARGYKRVDALLEAGPTRMRPIVMTTLAIVVSSIPTALALGRGAGFRQSLGIAVIGGVTLSLLVTPIVIPCAYLLFDNFTNFVGRIRMFLSALSYSHSYREAVSASRRSAPRMEDVDLRTPRLARAGAATNGNGDGYSSNRGNGDGNGNGNGAHIGLDSSGTSGEQLDDPQAEKLHQ